MGNGRPGTFPARINRRLCLQSLRLPRERALFHPFEMFLDPCNVCAMKCPFCPTTTGEARMSKRGILHPETFERIVSHVRLDRLRIVRFYNRGEPLLNPHLPDYVRRFADAGVMTEISTAAATKPLGEEWLRRLLAGGLTSLILSIDGATPASYAKYRVGGDFALAMENARLVGRIRREMGANAPVVTWRMLLMKHNEPELALAASMARDIGIEFHAERDIFIPAELRAEWLPDATRAEHGDIPSVRRISGRGRTVVSDCRELWTTLRVDTSGDVFACVNVQRAECAVGNLVESDISDIWNNAKMRKLRRYTMHPDEAPPAFANRCEGCDGRHCSRSA